MKRQIRYWDADCFLAWLKAEPEKATSCRGAVTGASKGEIMLVTSALTLVEVIKLKGRQHVTKADAKLISDFFKNEFIRVQNVDRYIAELARNLIWNHESLQPKDAIHVATAVKHEIERFDTFDEKLIKLSGKLVAGQW